MVCVCVCVCVTDRTGELVQLLAVLLVQHLSLIVPTNRGIFQMNAITLSYEIVAI